jgi:hypothetical protein
MPTPTTTDVLSQYRAELAKMEAAGIPNQERYNDFKQRINELEYEQYEENKARDAMDKGKRKGGTLKLKSGGKVRGCGIAKKGFRKAKMY